MTNVLFDDSERDPVNKFESYVCDSQLVMRDFLDSDQLAKFTKDLGLMALVPSVTFNLDDEISCRSEL